MPAHQYALAAQITARALEESRRIGVAYICTMTAASGYLHTLAQYAHTLTQQR